MAVWKLYLIWGIVIAALGALCVFVRSRLPRELRTRLEELERHPRLAKYESLRTAILALMLGVLAAAVIVKAFVGVELLGNPLLPIVLLLVGLFGILVVERLRRREIRALQQSGQEAVDESLPGDKS